MRDPIAGRTYGTIGPERRKAMSGLEFVKGLASGALPLNTMARTLGYDVVEAESGRVLPFPGRPASEDPEADAARAQIRRLLPSVTHRMLTTS